jgi:hypothetical protein
MDMGFQIHDADALVKKTRDTMAAAADNLRDAIDKLKTATMPSGTLGVLGDIGTIDGDLPSKYNDARDTTVDNLWTDIKAIVDSIHSVEKAIHDYNGADQDALNKIIFSAGDPLEGSSSDGLQQSKSDHNVGQTKPNESGDSGEGSGSGDKGGTSKLQPKASEGSGGGTAKGN